MGTREDAIRLWRAKQLQKQPTILRNRGILGDGLGNLRVPGRKDLSFMRVNADPNRIWKVVNTKVQDIEGLPVIIEKAPDDPLWQVVDVERRILEQSGTGWSDIKRKETHHAEHEFPDNDPGGDAVTVFPRALHDLRTEAVGSTYPFGVTVRPIRYSYSGLFKEFPGSLEHLASYTPVTGVRRILTYLDVRDNQLKLNVGAPVTYSIGAKPPRPAIPWYGKPSAFLTIAENQATIVEGDIEDIRHVVDEAGIIHQLQQERDPATSDDAVLGYSEGSIWINRLTNNIFICTNPSIGAATWVNLASLGVAQTFTAEKSFDANVFVLDTNSFVVGHTSPVSFGAGEPAFQVLGTDLTDILFFGRWGAVSGGAELAFLKSRSVTIGGFAANNDGDILGRINFYADDGVDYTNIGASIKAFADGTPASNDTPGRLAFFTTPVGDNEEFERMNIGASGRVGVGTSTGDSTFEVNGSVGYKVITITTTTYTAADEVVILVDDDTAGSAVTITLPAASGASNRVYTMKKLGTTANVTVDGNASETIDGATTKALTTQYEVVRIICDGSNWHII